MLRRLRLAIIGLVLILLLVTAAANPSWAATLGVDFWNLPDLHEAAQRAEDMEQELESESADANRRVQVKEELINSLIAGRMTLAEVADQFTVLNEEYANHMILIRQIYPGATDQEKIRWNVVDYAGHRMDHLAVWQRWAIMARLHAELQTLSLEFAAVPVN